jgi:hypothetical protein
MDASHGCRKTPNIFSVASSLVHSSVKILVAPEMIVRLIVVSEQSMWHETAKLETLLTAKLAHLSTSLGRPSCCPVYAVLSSRV